MDKATVTKLAKLLLETTERDIRRLSMNNAITARYNMFGYAIELNGEEIYRAGNNPCESSYTGTITPDSLKIDDILEKCFSTCCELCKEHAAVLLHLTYYVGAKKL